MSEWIDTLIIGGGQAGLALSYYLRQKERPHVILDQAAQCAEAWRNHRWDSFTLVTPNWSVRLPGAEYDGADPDGFLSVPDIVKYFQDYIERFDLPVRYNVRATQVRRDKGEGFIVETTSGPFQCKNVVVATGTYQAPKIPGYAKQIDPSIKQLHSGDYRNPSALVPGAVLVLGSGQSGCQIAEELYQSGRKVYLGTGTTARVPRRYRGRDIFEWLIALGAFNQTVDQLDSPAEKFESNPMISGKDGGHSLNLHQFARDGVTLLGRVQSATYDKVIFAPDLYSNLERSDKPEIEITKAIDNFIRENGLDAPAEIPAESLRDGYDAPLITELDLQEHGITTIIWATGYLYDFAWIDLPLFDGDGYPIQRRGATTVPGVYFLGFKWLHTAKSNLLLGVGEDAAYIADCIANQ